MPIETACRYQDAVYWPYKGHDAYGEHVVGDPVQIKVRWENVDQETIDANGNSVAVDAIVVVDRKIPVGSIFWLGTLKQLGLTKTPNSELRQVIKYTDVPDLKNRYNRRLVYLMRLSDEMAAVI